jgi:hypothetical protein
VRSSKLRAAGRRNIKKAAQAAKSKKTIAHLSAKTRSALGKQGAKVATGGTAGATQTNLRQKRKMDSLRTAGDRY